MNTYSSHQWTSSDTAVATISSDGSVTAVSPGSVTMRGTFKVNGTFYQVSFPLTVTELADGVYYLQNKFSDLYADIPNASMTEGAQLHQWTFHGAKQQRWKFTLKYDGYYSICSVNSGSVSYYMGVQNDSSSYDVAVVLRSTNLADGTRWTVNKTASGAYRISAKTGGSGKALAVATENADKKGGLLQQRYYVNDDNYKDEWIAQPAIFGIQTYREIEEHDYENINCHGYAMMRNDIPKDWCPLFENYCSNAPYTELFGQIVFSEEVKQSAGEYAKMDFENWLTENGYTWEYETGFSGNGENNPVGMNQYRVVMRTGIQIIIKDNRVYKQFDFHFWYQTYDGRWANKHGKQAPELLPIGVTPFSTSTSGWDADGFANFYDGPIYSYIITVN